MRDLKAAIRQIPDWPRKGILFYDVTTLLKDGQCFRQVVDALVAPFQDKPVEVVVGIEARGFIFAPTVALSRHIFAAPTRFYKTGVVFMAYLNGHQDHFAMVGCMQSARSALHYAEVFRLADRAKLLRDPELATARMAGLMLLHGI